MSTVQFFEKETMTKDEKQRFDKIERRLDEHIAEVPSIIASQQKELRDVWEKVNLLSQRLFGNGTKKGSMEDRLNVTEETVIQIQRNQWTKGDHEAFMESLQTQMDVQFGSLRGKIEEVRKSVKLPWLIITNVILDLGAIAAIVDLITRHVLK